MKAAQNQTSALASITPVSDAIRVHHLRRHGINSAMAEPNVFTAHLRHPIFFQDQNLLPPFDEAEIDNPEILISAAAEIFRMRRARDQHMPADLVGEPGWDILLALYAEEPQRLPVSTVCYASSIPMSTGLRWVGALVKRGLVERETHHRDGRVVLLLLTQKGRLLVERSLKAMLRSARF